MKKDFSFSVEITEEQINGPLSPHEVFGITQERAFQIISSCKELELLDRAAGEKSSNLVELFVRFLEREELSKNELAFLLYSGFTAASTTESIVRDLMANPMQMLGLILGNEEG